MNLISQGVEKKCMIRSESDSKRTDLFTTPVLILSCLLSVAVVFSVISVMVGVLEEPGR